MERGLYLMVVVVVVVIMLPSNHMNCHDFLSFTRWATRRPFCRSIIWTQTVALAVEVATAGISIDFCHHCRGGAAIERLALLSYLRALLIPVSLST